jgi:hypothetical protein
VYVNTVILHPNQSLIIAGNIFLECLKFVHKVYSVSANIVISIYLTSFKLEDLSHEGMRSAVS